MLRLYLSKETNITERRGSREKVDRISSDEEKKRLSTETKEGNLNQQRQSGIKEYNLVDFAARYQKGFRNNVVPIRKVPELLQRYKCFECYTTFFLYDRQILEHMKRNVRNGRGSVAGYRGKVWAPFFVMDIDSESLKEALEVSRQIVTYFLKRWDISQESLLVYFSGSAGFHIVLDTRIFGKIEPSENLDLVFAETRMQIARRAKVKKREAVDCTIKDKLRLFRLVNTINAKSGLYKVQLTLEELFESDIEDIRYKARKPQPIYFTDATALVSTENNVGGSEEAKDIFQYALRQIKNRKSTRVKIDYSLKDTEDPSKVLCKAREKIWNSHVRKGSRNNVAVRLIAQFRLSGFSKEKALKLIVSWNEKNCVDLPLEELLKSVESVYGSTYSYGCNDEILKKFCPFRDRSKCKDYRSFIENTSE